MMPPLLLQAAVSAASLSPLAGTWQAALDLAGGTLRFEVTIARSGGAWRGELSNLNSPWRAFSAVRVRGDSVVFEMADYDATIRAAHQGDSLLGFYHNVGNKGPRTIPFRAGRGGRRISQAPPSLLGRWDASYLQEGGASPRVFDFHNGPRGLEGRIFSSTTEYGPFVGSVTADSFALGLFDGSFVYLLTGRLDGDTLRGTFHAGLRAQTPWKAVRSTGPSPLRSPAEITQADMTDPFRFAFPDLEGRLVRSDDPRFRGKVVLVDIFGSWCPTCHEGTPELIRLYRRYHHRGLEIVGLAYEVTGDTAIDARQVRRYRDKFQIPFPLLLAGVNDDEAVEASLPQLRNFSAYPTLLVLDRSGRVRRVHAGFYGSAGGGYFVRQNQAVEVVIRRLLTAAR